MRFDASTPVDDLFEEALCHPASERRAFVESVAEDETVAAEVLQLLEGFEETESEPRSSGIVSTEEKAGQTIGHFRLSRKLGEGGMGSVWLAEQTEPVRREVALKIIKLGMDTRSVVQRFELERQVLAQLDHPNIARVHEAGATASGRPYFVMEFVDGLPIQQWCSQNKVGIEQRLRLFMDLCDTMQHAHQRGVMHRDLKPSNILVGPDGHVKVIDFGLARATQSDNPEASLLTQANQIFGTPAYMSPEQAAGDPAGVDNRTDVYSLGVVLFELLTGTTPFDPARLSTPYDVQRIVGEEAPPRPSTTHSTRKLEPGEAALPFALSPRGDLDWIVLKALEKEPERRYQSPAEFRADIERHLAGSVVTAVPPTLSYRLGKFVKRNRLAVVAGGLVFTSLLAALGISLRQTHRANEARTETEEALQTASDALGKEAAARAEATRSLASLCTSSGMIEVRMGDPGRGALWFAESAKHASTMEQSEAAHLRASSFGDPRHRPHLVVDTRQYAHQHILWHPKSLAVAVGREDGSRYFVYDLDGRQLQPDLHLANLSWDPAGHVFAATVGGKARLFRYPSGEEIWQAPGDRAVFSPNGSWIGFTGESAKLLSRTSNEERFFGKDVECDELRFSPKADRLLVINAEREVSLFSVDDLEKPLAVVGTKGPEVPPCGFIGVDGASFHLATGDEILVFETATGKQLASYEQEFPKEGVVASSPRGRYLAVRSRSLIDQETGYSLSFPPVVQLSDHAFDPAGAFLASGGVDFSIQLRAMPNGNVITTLASLPEQVNGLSFSPDGRWLASSEGTLLRIWPMVSAKPSFAPAGEATSAANPVRFVHQGRPLASHSSHGTAVIHSGVHVNEAIDFTQAVALPAGTLLGPVIRPGGIVVSAAIGPDPSWVVIGVSDASLDEKERRKQAACMGRVEVRSLASGELLGKPISLPSDPRSLAVHPDGTHVGILTGHGSLLEFDLGTHQLRQLTKPRGFLPPMGIIHNGRCAYSEDGTILFGHGMTDRFLAWNREKKYLNVPAAVTGAVYEFDQHEHLLAVGECGNPNQIHIWDLNERKAVRPPIPVGEWPISIQFHPDGERLLVGRRDKQAEMYHWRTGELAAPAMQEGVDDVFLARFVPGRDWALLVDKKAKLHLFECANGQLLRPPVQLPTYGNGAAFREDGNLLLNGVASCLVDLPSLLQPDTESVDEARTWAEIDSGAAMHAEGGGLQSLSTEAWLERWRSMRP